MRLYEREKKEFLRDLYTRQSLYVNRKMYVDEELQKHIKSLDKAERKAFIEEHELIEDLDPMAQVPGRYYKIDHEQLTEEEFRTYVLMDQARSLNAIHNKVCFISVVFAIFLILGFIGLLASS